MAKMTESLQYYGSSLNYVGGHSRDYSLCSSVSLWLGQSIAVHHIGEKIQRISDASSPITTARSLTE